MPHEQVLAQLEASRSLLTGADPKTFEQSEIRIRAALAGLRAHVNEPFLDCNDLHVLDSECRRVAGLLASAEEFYRGLTRILSIQTVGYGSAAANSPTETGRRFVIDG